MYKNNWIILLIVIALLGIGAFMYFTWPTEYEAGEVGTTTGTPIDRPAVAGAKTVQDSAWSWSYTQLPNGSTVTPDEPSDYLLAFDTTNKVVATTDCGTYLGSFTTDNSSDLSLVAFTQSDTKPCPTQSVETSYKQALAQTNSYRIDQDNLRLVLKDGSLMVFTEQYANK